jgi:hypothetical protein
MKNETVDQVRQRAFGDLMQWFSAEIAERWSAITPYSMVIEPVDNDINPFEGRLSIRGDADLEILAFGKSSLDVAYQLADALQSTIDELDAA